MYFNLPKLKAKAEACFGEMKALSERIEEAEGKNDAKLVETLTAEYKGKAAAFDQYDAQIKEAQSVTARRARLTELDSLTQSNGSEAAAGEAQGKSVIPNAGPAEAKDHDKAERELEGHFVDFMCGKSVAERALDAMRPTSAGWKEAAEKNAIVMPRRFANAVLPERNVTGKALPVLSTGDAGSKLFASEFKPSVQMYTPEAPAIFPRCYKIPTKSGTVLFPKLTQGAPGAENGDEEFAEMGYVACAWTAEGAEKPGTEPKFTQAEYKTNEVSAYTELSRTLINRSAIDIEMLLGSLFRASLLHKIDQAILNGDGVGKPLGILQTAGIGTLARAGAGAVAYDDFVGLEGAVAPQFRAGGIWMIADQALQATKKLKDDQKRPLFLQNMGSAPFGTIMGYGYVPNQRQPALGTAGDVVFGDPGYYLCPVEQEVVISRSEHYKFREGVIAFVAFAQVGGKVAQNRAFSKLIDAA